MASESYSEEAIKQANAFDHIAEHYETVFGHNENQIFAINWLIQRLPEKAHVLDVGSGTGEPTARLLSNAGHLVTGVDFSSEMIRIAKSHVKNATFLQTDLVNIRFPPDSFDAVVAFFSLLMLRRDHIQSAILQLKPMIKSSGYFLLSMVEGDFDYHEIQFLGESLRVSAYPRDVLSQILQDASFTILDRQVVQFRANEHAPPETQLFYFCQNKT